MERGGPEAPIDNELAHIHPSELLPKDHNIPGHELESPPVPIEYAGGTANAPTPSSEMSDPSYGGGEGLMH